MNNIFERKIGPLIPVIVILLSLILVGVGCSKQNTTSIQKKVGQQPKLQDMNATSFMIEGVADGGEPALDFNVIVYNDLSSYQFHVTGYSMWEVVYSNNILCFKKENYKRTYCILEKYSPLSTVRAFIEGEFDDFDYSQELTEYEEIAIEAVPNNALVAFLIRIELVIKKIREGDELYNGMQLAFKEESREIPFGTIVDVQKTTAVITLPKPHFDLIAMGLDLISKSSVGISRLSQEPDEDDSHIDFLADEYELSLNNYLR